MDTQAAHLNTVVRVTIGCDDGTDRRRVTLGMFLEANAGFVDADAIVAAIAAGQTYRAGGGAQPWFTLRRSA